MSAAVQLHCDRHGLLPFPCNPHTNTQLHVFVPFFAACRLELLLHNGLATQVFHLLCQATDLGKSGLLFFRAKCRLDLLLHQGLGTHLYPPAPSGQQFGLRCLWL